MALDADQTHLVYEVLGLPNDVSVLHLNDELSIGTTVDARAILTAKTQIDARLAALAAGPEARLVVLLAEWLKVSTTGTMLKPNTSNEGIDRNPARERRLIRRAVQYIVPVLVEGRDTGGAGVPLG